MFIMPGSISFDNRRCWGTVKVHDKSANDPLLINFHRVFEEKEIPELVLMVSHFLAEPQGIFGWLLSFGRVMWTLSVLASLGHISQRKRQETYPTHFTRRCMEVRPYVFRISCSFYSCKLIISHGYHIQKVLTDSPVEMKLFYEHRPYPGDFI